MGVGLTFGAAVLAVATALGFGLGAVRLLRLPAWGVERWLFAHLFGTAALSLTVFGLGLLGQLNRKAFWAVVALSAVAGWWGGRAGAEGGEGRRRVPPKWLWWFVVPFAFAYVIYALAPEASPDGAAYHLGLVVRYWQKGALYYMPHSIYAQLSRGMEMIFLFAFGFGGHSAAALQHTFLTITWGLLVASYGVRFGHPVVGAGAAILVFTSPVVGVDGASAYVDVAAATVLFGVHYLARLWEGEQRRWTVLFAAGLLAGFGYAIKYTAAMGLVMLVAMVCWQERRRVGEMFRGLAVAMTAAGLFMGPWIARTYYNTGNPFSPLFNAWFPNEVFDATLEADWLRYLREYRGLESYWWIPVEVTIRGEALQGLIGPAFLLAPLGLWALRDPAGRRWLFAWLILTLPYLSNIGTRFLIPGLPFLALAMLRVLSARPPMVIGMAVVGAILNWPQVAGLYCAPEAWRIRAIPWEAAFEVAAREPYLRERRPRTVLTAAIDRNTSPGERVFSIGPLPDAYSHAEIWTGSNSKASVALRRAIWLPLLKDRWPTDITRFWMKTERVRAARLTPQSAFYLDEIDFFDLTQEVGHSQATTELNESGDLTEWGTDNFTGSSVRLSDAVTVRFDPPRAMNRVDIVHAPLAEGVAPIELEIQREDGTWAKPGSVARRGGKALVGDLRRSGSRLLRRYGFRLLVVHDQDFGAKEIAADPAAWGFELVARETVGAVYRPLPETEVESAVDRQGR